MISYTGSIPLENYSIRFFEFESPKESELVVSLDYLFISFALSEFILMLGEKTFVGSNQRYGIIKKKV